MTLDLSQWMDSVQGSKKLSELSIPGTHDSGARDPQTNGDTKARLTTQARTIEEQLLDGIRFLDIRVGYKNKAFALYHEDVSLNLTFQGVLDTCSTFLNNHRRETIIMSVKKEDDAPGGGNVNGVSFQQRFDQYATASGLFYLNNAIPKLKDVRRKIVLFRRFALDAGTNPRKHGINAYDDFPDDGTGTIKGPPKLRIQDQFQQTDHTRADKWTAVRMLLDKASAQGSNPDVLYVNFASAAGILHNEFDDDFPNAVANDINPQLDTYFSAHTQGRFGIVVMDFETAARSRLIVSTNTLRSGR